VDYAIAKSSARPIPSAPYLLILEAKVEFPQFAFCQLLSQMSVCMGMNNEHTACSRPIYGALTNESMWQFYKLNADKTWQRSKIFNFSPDLKDIIGVLVEIVNAQRDSTV
jgi:hypothetical protein